MGPQAVRMLGGPRRSRFSRPLSPGCSRAMIHRVRGCVVIVGLALSTVCACSGGNVTSAHEARLRTTPEPTASTGPHCGVNLGYLPSGLRFHSAEGSPAQNEVNLR